MKSEKFKKEKPQGKKQRCHIWKYFRFLCVIWFDHESKYLNLNVFSAPYEAIEDSIKCKIGIEEFLVLNDNWNAIILKGIDIRFLFFYVLFKRWRHALFK